MPVCAALDNVCNFITKLTRKSSSVNARGIQAATSKYSLCCSVFLGGGTYPGRGGVPTLVRRYLPWPGGRGTYLRLGTYLELGRGGVPTLDWGVPTLDGVSASDGVPHQQEGRYPHPHWLKGRYPLPHQQAGCQKSGKVLSKTHMLENARGVSTAAYPVHGLF